MSEKTCSLHNPSQNRNIAVGPMDTTIRSGVLCCWGCTGKMGLGSLLLSGFPKSVVVQLGQDYPHPGVLVLASQP